MKDLYAEVPKNWGQYNWLIQTMLKLQMTENHFICLTHDWWYSSEMGVKDTACGYIIKYWSRIQKSCKGSMWKQVLLDATKWGHEVSRKIQICWMYLWRQFVSSLYGKEPPCWCQNKAYWNKGTFFANLESKLTWQCNMYNERKILQTFWIIFVLRNFIQNMWHKLGRGMLNVAGQMLRIGIYK